MASAPFTRLHSYGIRVKQRTLGNTGQASESRGHRTLREWPPVGMVFPVVLWVPSFHFPLPSSIARALETIFCLHPYPPTLQANPTPYFSELLHLHGRPAPFPVRPLFLLPGPSAVPAALQASQHRGHALERMSLQLAERCSVRLSPAFSHLRASAEAWDVLPPLPASHSLPQTMPGPMHTPVHAGTS